MSDLPSRRNRLRFSLGALMLLIAAIGLFLMLTLPIQRQGIPPCLTPADTLRWLISRPGMGRCGDCHSGINLADLPGDLAIRPDPGVLQDRPPARPR